MTPAPKQRSIDPVPVLIVLLLGFIVAVAIIADIKSLNSHAPGQGETRLEHSQTSATAQLRAETQQSVQSAQTPQQLEQERFAKMREAIAVQLHQTLNDAGYDIIVGTVSSPASAGGPTLLLHGDVYKDSTTRAESLEMLRSIANDRLCPWGFRQVTIGTGLFSMDHDYSLHCS